MLMLHADTNGHPVMNAGQKLIHFEVVLITLRQALFASNTLVSRRSLNLVNFSELNAHWINAAHKCSVSLGANGAPGRAWRFCEKDCPSVHVNMVADTYVNGHHF